MIASTFEKLPITSLGKIAGSDDCRLSGVCVTFSSSSHRSSMIVGKAAVAVGLLYNLNTETYVDI